MSNQVEVILREEEFAAYIKIRLFNTQIVCQKSCSTFASCFRTSTCLAIFKTMICLHIRCVCTDFSIQPCCLFRPWDCSGQIFK